MRKLFCLIIVFALVYITDFRGSDLTKLVVIEDFVKEIIKIVVLWIIWSIFDRNRK